MKRLRFISSSSLVVAGAAIAPASGFQRSRRVNVLASFPHAFLENLTVDANGTAFVTSYLEGHIYAVSNRGRTRLFAHVPGKMSGIAPIASGFLVAGWDAANTPCLWRIHADGHVLRCDPIPGSRFPNGLIRMTDRSYLLADSFAGKIFSYDPQTRRFATWLEDAALERSSATSMTPGVNGIRFSRGSIVFSNTDRRTLSKIELTASGPGAISHLARNITIDDFCIGPAHDIYAATHRNGSVVQISPDGEVTMLVKEPRLAGSTSVALDPTSSAVRLIVTTNGGQSYLPPSRVLSGYVLAILL